MAFSPFVRRLVTSCPLFFLPTYVHILVNGTRLVSNVKLNSRIACRIRTFLTGDSFPDRHNSTTAASFINKAHYNNDKLCPTVTLTVLCPRRGGSPFLCINLALPYVSPSSIMNSSKIPIVAKSLQAKMESSAIFRSEKPVSWCFADESLGSSLFLMSSISGLRLDLLMSRSFRYSDL